MRGFQSTRPARGATAANWPSNEVYGMFQSTRPARGATSTSLPLNPKLLVSIHAPRAGRDVRPYRIPKQTPNVSIHAPRAGRDTTHFLIVHFAVTFQSTRPARGATSCIVPSCGLFVFQSTRPARGATFPNYEAVIPKKFQSTRPARGATLCCRCLPTKTAVSIHAPRAGRDAEMRDEYGIDEVSIHAPRAGRDW